MYGRYGKFSYLGTIELDDFEKSLVKMYNNKQYDLFIISSFERGASESGMDKDPDWPQKSDQMKLFVKKMISDGGKDAFIFWVKETMNEDSMKQSPKTISSISKVLDFVSQKPNQKDTTETVEIEEIKEEIDNTSPKLSNFQKGLIAVGSIALISRIFK